MFVWESKLDFSSAKSVKNDITWSILLQESVLSIDHIILHALNYIRIKNKDKDRKWGCEY